MKQILKKGFVAIILLLSLQSCNDNEAERVFNEVPSVRLEEQSKELQELLKSSTEGWKATYFTDDTQLGGFSYLFKFPDNKTVEMASDFGGDDTVSSSEWDVTIGSTVKLTFTTKNKIHDLSDSNNYPDEALRGQGYKGSFEFLYYGTEGDDIIFRSNRDFIEVRFSKASATDWTDLVKNQVSISNIQSSPLKSVFRTLTVGTELYNFSYNPTRRYANSVNATGGVVNFGIGFTPTGITISPSIEYQGKEISTFTYDSVTDKFIATLDGTEVASISYSDTPAIPLTGYNDILKSNLRYNEIAGLSSSSPAFLAFLDSFRAEMALYGISIDAIYYRDMQLDTSWLQLSTSLGTIWFDFTKKTEDDKLFFEPTGATNANAALIGIFQPLLDVLFDTEGFYVENSGRLGNYTNGTFKFVPASNTTYKIHFYDF